MENVVVLRTTLKFPDLIAVVLAPYTDIIVRDLSSSVFIAQPSR